MAWRCVARFGMACSGKAGSVRPGMAWSDAVWLGKAGMAKQSPKNCTHIKQGEHSAVEIFEKDNEEIYGRCSLCDKHIPSTHPQFQLFLGAALSKNGRMAAKGDKT
jgi:hypothetical protein